jgi:hypothetical protein
VQFVFTQLFASDYFAKLHIYLIIVVKVYLVYLVQRASGRVCAVAGCDLVE